MGSSGGGLFGGVRETLFGDGGAGAAQNAAMAQQTQAQRAYRETRDIVNPATTQGMASLDRDIKNQEKNLARQEQLISQIDPTIIEASQQALRLLRGDKASTLGPLEQQRATARQKLVNQLRTQLGPGAETSSAGIKALTAFDQETSGLFAGAQQQALSNLGGVSSQFSSQRPDMLREIQGLSNFGQGKTNLQFQRAAALSNARQGLMQTAGAQYTGDAIRGQANASFGQAMLGAGAQVFGGYLGGAGSAAGGAAKAATPGVQAGQSYLNVGNLA